MDLHEHQKKIVKTTPNKFSLWMRPRTGKTPTSIRLACSRVKSCLIITPKHIKEQWIFEIEKWNNTDCKFEVITKERFRIDSIAGVKKRGRGKQLLFSDKITKYEAVVIDEIHRQGANYKNNFFKTLEDYLKRNEIKYLWLLSGTPWNKNPDSVYSYLKLLGIELDFWTWRTKYYKQVKYGVRTFWKPNEAMFPELADIISKIGVTVKLEDVVDIAEDYNQVEYFDLNAEQKRLIKGLTDTTPGAKYVKRHQIEQGVLKSDGYSESILMEIDKDKRILELAEENDKLLIVCRYLDQIEKYRKLLTECGYSVYIISGQMTDNLKELCDKVNLMDKAIVLLQADKSDGFDLKSFSTMIFASMSYSYISWDQMCNRMKSLSKKEGCTYYYLLSRGDTVDNKIYKSIQSGKDFSDRIYEL